MPNLTSMKQPRRPAVAKRRYGERSAPVRSPTAGPIGAGATGSGAATCRALLLPSAHRMIRLPMPRASPNSGGGYDPEVQAVLVEIHR